MFFALVIAVGLGLVVQMLLRPVPKHCFDRVIWAALSVGLGLGISSLTYFLWLVLPVTSPLGLLAIELSTIVVGVIVLILRNRRQSQTSLVEDEGRTGPIYDVTWLIAPVLGALSLT